MDIGKSFTFIFEDDEWITKVLVGALVVLACFTLVGIPFLLGYMLATMRGVMGGAEEPLPAWDDLGTFFKEGLILALVFIAWSIPIWIIALLQAIFGALLGGSYDAARTVGLFATCLSCLSGLWGIVMALFAPAIFTRFAQTPEFKSGFEFADLWQYTRDNIGNVIIAMLLGGVAYLLSSFGAILCGVGIFATMFWAAMVTAHLYGQIYVNRKAEHVEAAIVE